MQTLTSLLALGLVLAGILAILGFAKTSKKVFAGVIAIAVLVAIATEFSRNCGNSFVMTALMVAGILALALISWKLRIILKMLWWLVSGYVILSYRFGRWITENIVRFPVVLLPSIIKQIVMLLCFLIPQTILATCIILISINNSGITIDNEVWIYLGLPLVLTLIMGNIGKMIYRKREGKGLANV